MNDRLRIDRALMRALVAETIGTFALVFAGAFLYYLFIQLENYGIYFARHKAGILPAAVDQ